MKTNKELYMGSVVERINNLIKETERTRNISELNKTVIDLKDRITLLEAENKRLEDLIKEATENALELNKNNDIQCQETKT